MKKSTSESQSDHISDRDIEDLRIAYQAIPQMIAYEGQKPWNALSVFIQLAFVLAAGAIVPSFLPESSSGIVFASVGIFLSLSGIVAAMIWIDFDKRSRKITSYWVLSARDLEDKLSGLLEAFQRGKEFSKGDKVIVSGETVSYDRFERLPERTGFIIVYCVFVVVFSILFLLNVYRFYVAF
jgi:hypothetical protein